MGINVLVAVKRAKNFYPSTILIMTVKNTARPQASSMGIVYTVGCGVIVFHLLFSCCASIAILRKQDTGFVRINKIGRVGMAKPIEHVKACVICSSEFQTKNTKRMYCSKSCAFESCQRRFKAKSGGSYSQIRTKRLRAAGRCEACAKLLDRKGGRCKYCLNKAQQRGQRRKECVGKTYSAERQERMILERRCLGCGRNLHSSEGVYCTKCCKRSAQKRAKKVRLGYCRACGNKRESKKPTYCVRCYSKVKIAIKRYHTELRMAILAAYGNKCVCCGQKRIEFLEIDHIAGGGNKHRKLIRRSGPSMYLWLKQQNFPPGFRVLCINCNMSRALYGYCPHQKEKETSKPSC
jgi:hypothetical protein